MNIFRVLGLNYEIFHSRMLRWLWDPEGDHGAGTIFLAPFLERLGLVSSASVSLMTEVKIAVLLVERWRLADIVLRFDDVLLLVENKTDPSYQDADQIREEIAGGRVLAESEGRRFVFALIAPGRFSTGIQEVLEAEGGHFISWKELLSIYAAIDLDQLDPVVAGVIRQYIEFFQKKRTVAPATDSLIVEVGQLIDTLLEQLEPGEQTTAPALWQQLLERHPDHSAAMDARWADSSHYSSKSWFAARLQRLAAARSLIEDTGNWMPAPADWGFPKVRVYRRTL